MKNEQKFYSALENIFIGEAGQKIEGKSGYVNLMKLKSQYFAQIKPFIEKEVNDTFKHDTAAREEAFQKLYTFFESYLNETGTPYFSQTPFHKNLYEKVYSEREDVSLFWKTQRLYYVKSEANYHSLQNMIVDGLTFNFDASQIEHQKNNEKKSLEFWATQLTADSVTFKVVYEDNSKSKWERLKEYLKLDKPDEIRKHLAENFGDKSNPNIVYRDNGLSREGLKAKQCQSALLISNNADLTKTVTVEFALSNLEDLEAWAKHNKLINLTVRENTFKKAQQLYKKQNEVDYFIHKDAEGFLKEQLDMFLYQYLFGDRHLGNEWTQTRIDTIQKLKRIAHKIINYIARFEDELKHIWEKKKMVKQVNYVFTLDRLFPIDEKGERNFADKKAIALVEKIIADKGFEKQIEEYKHLHEQWTNDKGEVMKIVWREFAKAAVVDKKEIIKTEKKTKTLNKDYSYLSVDTTFFPSLKFELLKHFENIEKQIDGTLIKSDNWQALNTLLPKYNGQVDLIYIDPPFNTGKDFDYKDAYQDSTWLTLMENRLLLSKDWLSKAGSFYLHLDENADHLGRILTDSILGKTSFKREIIWDIQVLSGYKTQVNSWVLGHQTILYFVKSLKEEIFNKQRQPHRKEYLDRFDKTDKDGRKYFDGRGTIQYLDEVIEKGKAVGDVWFDIMSFQQNSTSLEKVDFETQKPELLLKRIIKSSTSNTSVVIDYFSGSATTIATAHKLKCKWVGIEIGVHFETINIPRLKKVLVGDQQGISKDEDVNWKGGGFFKYYELEQYEECLARASYNPKKLNKDGSINELEQLAYYTFRNSEKLLSAMLIDEEKEEVKVHFQTLYPEMDEAAIAETISNVSGKRIKTLSKEKVEFEDGSKIEFAKMNYDDKVFRDHYKALLWWKSKE